MVFATLLREGWLKEDELSGIGEERLRKVMGLATLR